MGSPLTAMPAGASALSSRPSPPWVRQLSDDTAPCHQQLPLCQPGPNHSLFLCRLGGRGWRGPLRGELSEKAGEEREGPITGHLPLGCEDKPRHELGSKQGIWGAPSFIPRSSHLRSLPVTLHQNHTAGEACEVNQPHLQLPPESVAFSHFPASFCPKKQSL